jgi:hypothetical protein
MAGALSRPNLNLDGANLGGSRGLRRLEVEFQCFLQVGKSLVFALTLAGHVYFQTLRNIPLPLAPDGSGELSLHINILSHDGRLSHSLIAVR